MTSKELFILDCQLEQTRPQGVDIATLISAVTAALGWPAPATEMLQASWLVLQEYEREPDTVALVMDTAEAASVELPAGFHAAAALWVPRALLRDALKAKGRLLRALDEPCGPGEVYAVVLAAGGSGACRLPLAATGEGPRMSRAKTGPCPSIEGMTRAARKRAARIWFCAYYGRPDRCKDTDQPGQKPLTRRYRLNYLWGEIRRAYLANGEEIAKDALFMEARRRYGLPVEGARA